MSLNKTTMKVIGSNIRRERILRNMSIEELSEILQLSTAFVGLIERGQRGVKLSNLLKIADIFGITVNDLVYNRSSNILEVREENENEETLRQQKKDAIMSLVYDFSSDELHFIITAIKGVRTLKKNDGEYDADFDDEDDDKRKPVNY